MGAAMFDELKNYFSQRNEQNLRENLLAEQAMYDLQDDYFEHNMRVMKNRHARLLFSTKMLVMVLIVSAIQFLFQELLSNLVYGIQAAFSVDCSSSCLPSLKMTLLTTKVNKLNP